MQAFESGSPDGPKLPISLSAPAVSWVARRVNGQRGRAGETGLRGLDLRAGPAVIALTQELSSPRLEGPINSDHGKEESVGVIQERYEFVMDIESPCSVIQGIDDDAG